MPNILSQAKSVLTRKSAESDTSSASPASTTTAPASTETSTQEPPTTTTLPIRSEMSPSLSLAGKVALVTGGSKGIGRSTCVALAKAGATVVINYSSDSSAADSLVSEIGKEQAFTMQADAGSVTGAEQMVKATAAKFGKIDILVANAGILPMKTLEDTTEEDFDKTYALNVKGPYFLCQKAVPYMPEGSHIIMLSTTLCHASTVMPNYLLYNSTKGAIEQMVRVMAKGLAPKGISVNAVAPGPTATELFLKGKPEGMLKTIAGMSPYNRLGKPDEIADSIVFLGSESSRWITGQVLKVNGGMA